VELTHLLQLHYTNTKYVKEIISNGRSLLSDHYRPSDKQFVVFISACRAEFFKNLYYWRSIVYLAHCYSLFIYFLFFNLSIIFIFLTIDLTDKQACCKEPFNSTTDLNALLWISVNPEALILIMSKKQNLINSCLLSWSYGKCRISIDHYPSFMISIT